jgi:hypothetical protein
MCIDYTGNVGIGGTNIKTKLHITHDGPDYTNAITNDRVRIMNRVDTGDAQYIGNEYGLQMAVSGTGNSTLQTISYNNSTNTVAAGYNLQLQPNGGRVGIGTTSPQRTLDVSTSGSYGFGNDVSIANERGLYWHNASDYSIHRTSEAWSSPNYAQLKLTWTTGIVLQTARGTYGKSFVGVDDRMSIGASYHTTKSPTNGLIVEGNVGIGTTDPLGRLHVQTETRSGTAGSGNGIYVTSGSAEYSNGSEFRHSNQSQGVGIGYAGIYATGSNTDQSLFIISRGAGNTYVKNYQVHSDDRIKTNEEYITNATETLMKLKPQVYDKHEKINVLSDNPKREAGLIAQDIYYDTPELRYIVSTRNEGIDAEPVNIPSEKPFVDDDPQKDPDYSGWGTGSAGVAYIQLVPYLIKSNQEIYTELQAEKVRNDSLEARILALENA